MSVLGCTPIILPAQVTNLLSLIYIILLSYINIEFSLKYHWFFLSFRSYLSHYYCKVLVRRDRKSQDTILIVHLQKALNLK